MAGPDMLAERTAAKSARGGASLLERLRGRLRGPVRRVATRLLALGAPPACFGWRWVLHETPAEHVARRGSGRIRVLQPRARAEHPLPANVEDRAALPDIPSWWGYSMHDVPTRTSEETYLARLSAIRIAAYRDEWRGNFTLGMIDKTGRAVDMPQIRFRPPHGAILRSAPRLRVEHATWFVERVYHNHSHWLTAHLPKLLLLKERDMLDDVIMPKERTATMEASLAMIGIDPAQFRNFDPDTVLEVADLRVLVIDRFRPELLRRVRAAFALSEAAPAHRRVFISRARAQGRKLLNEDTLWPALEARGFERVVMETLDFPAQVRLMNETAVLVAPHGAGLTNMMFCPEGADVVEIADPDYPNPNFYAVASAMGHRFWLMPAAAEGTGHALFKDLRAAIPEVLGTVDRIEDLRRR